MPQGQGVENIITKSSSLLMKQGYSSTSMSDIGALCKLNKASLYHYFKSKDELVAAVIDDLSEKFSEDVFSRAYDDSKPAKKRLNDVLNRIQNYFLSSKGCLMWQLATELAYSMPALTDKINDFFDLWSKTFCHLFESQYTKKQARVMAVDSILQIEGAVIWLRMRNDPLPLKRIFKEMKALLD